MGILEGLRSNPLNCIAAKPEFCGCKWNFCPSWVFPLCMQLCAHTGISTCSTFPEVSCCSWPLCFPSKLLCDFSCFMARLLTCWLFLLAHKSFFGEVQLHCLHCCVGWSWGENVLYYWKLYLLSVPGVSGASSAQPRAAQQRSPAIHAYSYDMANHDTNQVKFCNNSLQWTKKNSEIDMFM